MSVIHTHSIRGNDVSCDFLGGSCNPMAVANAVRIDAFPSGIGDDL